MTPQTLLYLMSIDTPDDEILSAANDAQAQNAQLDCLIVAETPPLPFGAYGGIPYVNVAVPAAWPDEVRETTAKLADRVNEVEQLLARQAASGMVNSVLASDIDIGVVVARHAGLADIAFVSPTLRTETALFRAALNGVLFNSPIGALLNGSPLPNPEHVFIAWNAGLAAGRAIHAGMRYITAAKTVTIGCFDPITRADADGQEPGSDLARWLSHKGCDVTVSQYPTGGEEIGRVLLDRSVDVGADLIIMGAYGHTRLREAVFGGTSRTMMEQTHLPVLFAH